MGDKSIRKETKKKKKADTKPATDSVLLKSVVAQPELIKKKKKDI
jgi:hypothetical protein